MPPFLAHKLVGLPVWGWLLGAGGMGAYVVYRRRKAAQQAAAAVPAMGEGSAAYGPGLGYGGGGTYTFDYGPAPAAPSTTQNQPITQGNPAPLQVQGVTSNGPSYPAAPQQPAVNLGFQQPSRLYTSKPAVGW